MQPTEAFDELHVISDLHLGGARPFQIFDQGTAAEALLELLATASGAKVGLVINGDFVDFLAEPNASCFDPEGAVAKLERIFGDASFQPVWRGLSKLVQSPNRRLVIVLGNHDLELALPWVRERLAEELAGSDEAARGRIQFVQDGAGFRCRVGNSNVLCVHGNEVDPWNVADYERLRRTGRDVIQGRAAPAWIPNAGSQLVIEVMNGIKRRHPFVDLLKPEEEAVVPVLLALDPGQAAKLGEIAASAARLAFDQARAAAGLLGAEEVVEAPAQPVTPEMRLESLLQRRLRVPEVQVQTDSVDALLSRAEQRLQEDRSPFGLIDHDQRQEYLGKLGALLSWIRGKPKSEVLRVALDGVKRDRSFDVANRDAFFNHLDELMGREIDYIVAGHTHHERALPRGAGNGFYYNSGTWARLIRLTDEVLDDAAKFAKVFAAFEAGTMDALDAEPDLVIRKPTVVSVCRDGASAYAELRHVRVAGGQATLEPVPGTRFRRS